MGNTSEIPFYLLTTFFIFKISCKNSKKKINNKTTQPNDKKPFKTQNKRSKFFYTKLNTDKNNFSN